MIDTAPCPRRAVNFIERFGVRDDRLLTPDQTCWRVARADQFACVIDAAEYFKQVKAAMLRARMIQVRRSENSASQSDSTTKDIA